MLVSDGEIDPPRDRGPRLDESVPDAAIDPHDDGGFDATPGDAGCAPTDGGRDGERASDDGADDDPRCGDGAA